MAGISTGQSKIGIIAGSVWGTAVALTGTQGLRGRLSFKNQRGAYSPQDIGFTNFIQDVIQQEESVDVTLTAEWAFDSLINQAIAHFLANDTPTEVTGGQGDYSHVMKMQESNDGEFTTLAFFYDKATGKVIELPSVKWNSLNIEQNRMGPAIVTMTGIADRMVLSSFTSDYAAINGLTFPTFELGMLGGTNAYFRMNAASGAGLSNSNDLQIMGYKLSVTRPMERDFVLRGANTKYSLEPLQMSPAVASLELRLPRIDSAAVDIVSLFTNGTTQKAEVFFDGTQIGTGVNRSYKIQMPKLKLVQFPSGFDLPNNNSRMRPVLNFNVLQAAAAPTGMTGITDYVAITAVSTRATALT